MGSPGSAQEVPKSSSVMPSQTHKASAVGDQISPQGHAIPYPAEMGKVPQPRYFYNNQMNMARRNPSEPPLFERMTKSLAKNEDGVFFQRLMKKSGGLGEEIFERLTKREPTDEDVFQRLTRKSKEDQVSQYVHFSYIPFQKMRFVLRPLTNIEHP